MLAPYTVRTRRSVIRLFSFTAAMTAVLFSTICMQLHLSEDIAASQNRLRRSVLAHMNEENEGLRTALSASDKNAVLRHTGALCGYAAMLMSCGNTEDETPLISALTDTAHFYSALERVTQQTQDGEPIADLIFWQSCTDTVSEHIASMALALSDRLHPGCPSDAELTAARNLSAITASFKKDPLRMTADTHPGYSFDREPPVTEAEARQILRSLVGSAASFLGSTVIDDTHGCYVFTCQNGYAEISQSGHLLSYAFYPRSTGEVASHPLNDTDLSQLAAVFLKKAGIPVQNTDVWEDRHGIRSFRVRTENGRAVTVGLRMSDGTVVQLRADAYYRRDDSSHA